MKRRSKIMLYILVLYVTAVLTLAAVTWKHSSICPLWHQGCDCGRICTKKFDCVRGQHE